MAIKPTRFSRVSIGFMSSTESIVDYDAGDTGAVFSVTGPYALNGAATVTGNQSVTGTLTVSSTGSVGGALTLGGAATMLSTLTVAGVATLKGIRSTSNNTLTSNTSIGGGLTVDSNVTLNSRVSVAGDLVATGGLFVGSSVAANELVSVSVTTASVDFGSVAPLESSVVTVGVSGATRGDMILFQPDSIWSGAYFDLSLAASVSGSTSGEVSLGAANSTLTAVDPAATVFRFVRIGFASYI